MFDTFRINLSDETKIDTSKAKIKIMNFPSVAGETLKEKYELFYDIEGVLYTGDKAFFNHELFNLTIFNSVSKHSETEKRKRIIGYDNNYKKFSIPVETKINEKYNSRFFLQFSLPKIYSYKKNNNTYNLKSLNDDEIIESFSYLNLILKENGIITILDDAILSRVDLFNNVTTKRKFETYGFLYKNLFLSRKENFSYDNKTFLYKNKQNQICIYDKIHELKKIHKIDLTGNITRFENRFMNKKKILSMFGSNLRTGGILQNKKEYKNEMINLGNLIFEKDFYQENKKINIENIDKIILRYKNENKKEKKIKVWYVQLLNDLAISMLSESANFDEVKELFKDNAESRMQLSNIKKIFNNANLKNQIKTKKRVQLYNELKEQYFLNLN